MLMPMHPTPFMTDAPDQVDPPMIGAGRMAAQTGDGEATPDSLADDAWARHALGANGFGDVIGTAS